MSKPNALAQTTKTSAANRDFWNCAQCLCTIFSHTDNNALFISQRRYRKQFVSVLEISRYGDEHYGEAQETNNNIVSGICLTKAEFLKLS